MRITSKGQVTIPIEIRRKLGLLPETEVQFDVRGEYVRMRKVSGPGKSTRGQRMVDRMRGKATVELSTDEILALTRGEA